MHCNHSNDVHAAHLAFSIDTPIRIITPPSLRTIQPSTYDVPTAVFNQATINWSFFVCVRNDRVNIQTTSSSERGWIIKRFQIARFKSYLNYSAFVRVVYIRAFMVCMLRVGSERHRLINCGNILAGAPPVM